MRSGILQDEEIFTPQSSMFSSMSYASIFVIKGFFKQWRPSTAKSEHSIAIQSTLLIK